MNKIISKNKILFSLSISFAAIFLVGNVFANYLVEDNADPLGFRIQINENTNYYLVGEFSNNEIKDEYLLSFQNDSVYAFGDESDNLLCHNDDIIHVCDGKGQLLCSYTIPLEGTYSFLFNESALELSTLRYTKAVYLRSINSTRLWDKGFSVYAWDSTGKIAAMDWANEGKMLYDEQSKAYKYLIKEAYDYLIFHNSHDNTSDSRIQTGDLAYDINTPLYQMSSNKSGTWTTVDTPSINLHNDTFDHYLVVSMNSWTTQDPIYGMEFSGDNSQEIYSLYLKSGDSFKIVGSTGWDNQLNYYNIESSKRVNFNTDSDSNIIIKTTGNYTFYAKNNTIYYSMF